MEQIQRDGQIKEVDVLIVGAGPGALGLLCNAKKHQKLESLVQTGKGLAILEQGNTFGGGSLQNYIINSNTSADGFLQCLQAQKGHAQPRSTSADKGKMTAKSAPATKRNQTLSPRKSGEGEDADNQIEQEQPKKDRLEIIIGNMQKPLLCFAKLQSYDCPIFTLMKEFGPALAPLEVVGMLLNYVGNYLLYDIHARVLKDKAAKERQVFYPGHKVIDIVMLDSGSYLVTALK